jgi:anti-anti-sigma factor
VPRFSIDVRVDGTDCEIFVGGDVDPVNADQLATVGVLAIERSRAETVIVDLGGVGSFEPAGVEALVRIQSACTARAKELYARNLPAHLNLDLAGLKVLLPETVDGRD